jgi:plasmid stabilization system protein ParE
VRYSVGFAPEAADQLVALRRYLAQVATADVAASYVERIVSYCEGFAEFPHRGTMRDDLRPGVRVTSYRKRAVIAFAVDDHAKRVSILGVFYGGQDYESVLGADDDGET